ncbi:uncharacterized protein PRCAT00004221001 [Priceomyces carsonii]|uniref:uncharacterized protein n=1 Tax=Priceomyces carsonii TaxID=28549 RepID=UPI002EDB482D|nr:unnamed protein product [Priceomyces carsonii]
MSESSRSINHKLNELLSKHNISKATLDIETALSYASVLRTNILGKDKQEKVNSIVVLGKLLDCSGDVYSDEFSDILDDVLFRTLYSIISTNMSTETYKAIIKISMLLMMGSLFRNEELNHYLPIFESLNDNIEVIDIIAEKTHLQDPKITSNSIRFVTELISRATSFEYDGIIPIVLRLRRVKFFSTVATYPETEERSLNEVISQLRVAYSELNEAFSDMILDSSLASHQFLIDQLVQALDLSLNPNGVHASKEDYKRAGFPENITAFIVSEFSVLLAVDLVIFLEDQDNGFKKLFHETLLMDRNVKFPLYSLFHKSSIILHVVFHQTKKFPNIASSTLNRELMISYTMTAFLWFWKQTMMFASEPGDLDKLASLVQTLLEQLEIEFSKKNKTVKEIFDLILLQATDEMRTAQVAKINKKLSLKWEYELKEFTDHLISEASDFVLEQRVSQLFKGSWVFTEDHGDSLLKSKDNLLRPHKVYFVTLSPNKKNLYYKPYFEKPSTNPTYEEIEGQFIKLSDVVEFILTDMSPPDDERSNMGIMVSGSISQEKITIMGINNRKLLSFYPDSQFDKSVWLDGLRMLRDNEKEDEKLMVTEDHLRTLVNVRMSSQLFKLEKEDPANIEENDYYDPEELETVTESFYYGSIC